MSNDLTGQNIADETTAEPMPSSNEPAEEAQDASELPGQVSERTATEFEKLKQRNKALAEKLAVLEGNIPNTTSVLDELRPSADLAQTKPIAGNTPSIPTDQHNQPGIIDDGGYVDAALLNAELRESRRQAEEARRIALETQQNIQRFQETEVVRQVHAQFPQLNPNNLEQFDRTFYDLVKNELHGQFAQGKRNLMDAAVIANKLYQTIKPSQPTVDDSKAQQDKIISSRVQASAKTGTSTGTPTQTNHEELVRRTYKGDNDAIYARLRASEKQ